MYNKAGTTSFFFMEILIKLSTPKHSIVFPTYWRFAAERQKIFFNKFENVSSLTEDPIFLKHKFTNAYRATDRVSQYLIKNVIYSSNKEFDEKNILYRILLFKIFNKISTWEALESEFGAICIENFNFKNYSNFLSYLKDNVSSIYSGAYIMTSGKSIFGYDKKHENHLKLLEEYVIQSTLLECINLSSSLEDVYNTLLKIPTFGQFLAFQYAIDINYSTLIDFSEMDFVKAGPGAIDGIQKCFTSLGDYSYEDVIKYMAENQDFYFDKYELDFQSLWGRSLQLIDCQNLFCEVDKYSRVAHPEVSGLSNRKRIKQIYRPNVVDIDYFLPPKWGLLINH